MKNDPLKVVWLLYKDDIMLLIYEYLWFGPRNKILRPPMALNLHLGDQNSGIAYLTVHINLHSMKQIKETQFYRLSQIWIWLNWTVKKFTPSNITHHNNFHLEEKIGKNLNLD